jgi:hypothetical protein
MLRREPAEGIGDFETFADLRTVSRYRGIRLLERNSVRNCPKLAAPRIVGVEEDPKEPGAHIGARREPMEAAPGKQHRLLHQIVGAVAVAAQAPGDAQQAGNMRHRHPLEFGLARAHLRA